MSYKVVFVCKKCHKVYNKELGIALPMVCKKCGEKMRTSIDVNWGNVRRVVAKRKLFGWEIPDIEE